MLATFLTTVKVLVRDKNVIMWAVAFPLVLSTLFYCMFSHLDELYTLDPLAVVVIDDENYRRSTAFAHTLDALSTPGTDGSSALVAPTFVATEDAALAALKQGNYLGYLSLDAHGTPHYAMDSRHDELGGTPSQSIIKGLLNRYVQNAKLITSLATQNPQLLQDPSFLASLTQSSNTSFTERVSVTANPPSDTLRYYYAVLAFSTIMMATFALTAVDRVQGNTSALGARRSLGGQSKLRTLVPTMGAAWMLSFACVLIGFLYIRFVFGASFGGKEPAVVLTLAVSTLAANFLGAFIGALPLPGGTKAGFVSLLSCTFSLFAGLYGPFSQDLGDLVARDFPLLSAGNPVRQVADAFFSLYYYDGYEQLTLCLLALGIFCAVFFVLSVLIMRRQRYASL